MPKYAQECTHVCLQRQSVLWLFLVVETYRDLGAEGRFRLRPPQDAQLARPPVKPWNNMSSVAYGPKLRGSPFGRTKQNTEVIELYAYLNVYTDSG